MVVGTVRACIAGLLIHRTVIINQNTTLVQLNVERLGYLGKVIMVTYRSVRIDAAVRAAGQTISPAVEATDYLRSVGTINFDVGVVSNLVGGLVRVSLRKSFVTLRKSFVTLHSVTAQ